MLLGAIGIATILFLAMYTLDKENPFGYLGFIGVALVILYINFLEKKAAISTKLIWIKAVISMVLLLLLSLYYSYI